MSDAAPIVRRSCEFRAAAPTSSPRLRPAACYAAQTLTSTRSCFVTRVPLGAISGASGLLATESPFQAPLLTPAALAVPTCSDPHRRPCLHQRAWHVVRIPPVRAGARVGQGADLALLTARRDALGGLGAGGAAEPYAVSGASAFLLPSRHPHTLPTIHLLPHLCLTCSFTLAAFLRSVRR